MYGRAKTSRLGAGRKCPVGRERQGQGVIGADWSNHMSPHRHRCRAEIPASRSSDWRVRHRIEIAGQQHPRPGTGRPAGASPSRGRRLLSAIPEVARHTKRKDVVRLQRCGSPEMEAPEGPRPACTLLRRPIRDAGALSRRMLTAA